MGTSVISQIKDVVYNTLDICGSCQNAVKYLCNEIGIDFDDNVQREIFRAMQQYQRPVF
jgi:hypothetical protein